MKKFIFLSPEGKTISPKGKDMGNMQVIGIIEDVANEDDALKKLLQTNSWIIEAEFNVADFLVYEIL